MIELAPQWCERELNWYDANRYCMQLDINGKLGWRLPTREELWDITSIAGVDLKPINYWTITYGGMAPDMTIGCWIQYAPYTYGQFLNADRLAWVRPVIDIWRPRR